MTKILFTLLVVLTLSNSALAQKKDTTSKMKNRYELLWQQAKKFANKNLTSDANKIYEKIYAKAQVENNSVHKLNAILSLCNNKQEDDNNNSNKNGLLFLEQELKKTIGIEHNILSSYLAQLLWQSFNNERYNILNRTNTQNATLEITALETWNAQQYFDAISNYYTESLKNETALLKTKANTYPELITVSTNTKGIRENLFEILAQRAIDFYKQDVIEITKPSYSFEINDARAFETSLDFCNYKLQTSDSKSNKYKCLSLYQQLMQLNIKNQVAFDDIDLDRLVYVHEHCALENKDLLYVQALQNFINKNKTEAISGYAQYLIAEQLNQENFRYTYLNNIFTKATAKNFKINKLQLKEMCKNIIAKWPKSEGGYNATNLLNNLNTKHFSIKTEACYLPNENILANISYTNIEKIFVKIFERPNNVEQDEYIDVEKKISKLNKLKAIKYFELQLPMGNDGLPHNSDFKIEGLPNGKYAIMFSENENYKYDNNCMALGNIQVSALNYFTTSVDEKSKHIFVINRKNGAPISNATVNIYRQDYNNKTRKDELNFINKYTTDNNGQALIRQANGNYLLEIVKDKIKLLPQQNLGIYYNNYDYLLRDKVVTKNTIFTDRSIYRPGQIIFFKSISTLFTNEDGKTVLNTNAPLQIDLIDPNYQIVTTLNITTNKYGSIAGQFTAPQNLLPGSYQIKIGGNASYINIEEYKRPKFEIVFDTIQGDYALNKMVTIKGKAMAFAGNAIGDASIKYNINRSTHCMYKWMSCYWPIMPINDKVIAQGETKTNADGSFEITFMASADNAIDKNTFPQFNFDINITATDLNGETHDANKVISVGYSDVIISLTNIDNKININTKNNNGNFKATPITFTCYTLKTPQGNFRKKNWNAPDAFIMNAKDFKTYFPIDEYGTEHQIEFYETEKQAWQKTFVSTNNNEFELDKLLPDDGDYKLVISTINNLGDTITDQIFVTQNKATISKSPAMLLTNTNKPFYKPNQNAATTVKSWPAVQHIIWFNAGKDSLKYNWVNNKAIENIITTQDRGNINNNYVYAFENRIYQHEQQIKVPYFNTDLKIALATFRDKIEPGSQQEWQVKISGGDDKNMDAELLASMYDASLDALKMHTWDLNAFENKIEHNFNIEKDDNENNFEGECNYATIVNSEFVRKYNALNIYQMQNNSNREYNIFNGSYAWSNISIGGGRASKVMFVTGSMNMEAMDAAPVSNFSAIATSPALQKSFKFSPPIIAKVEEVKEEDKPIDPKKPTANQPALRKNFNETAFWQPQLHIDEQGNYVIKFTSPEALTKWKCMLYAHGTNLQNAYLEKEIVTQKDLMVVTNTPRFMRQGDDMLYTFKVSNMSNKAITGTTTFQLIDAVTNQNIDAICNNKSNSQALNIEANNSASFQFAISIPADFTNPIIVKTMATAGALSDGEQNIVPVLSNRMMLTETMPYSVRAGETKTISLPNLLNAKNSNTLKPYSFTIENTNNPAWYAVQALPYLQEFPHECAEQTFSRYYANALATHIANSNPKIKKVFEIWRTKNKNLESNLQKNQELKNILLQETPWVLEAKNETEQMQNIALLFDLEKMSANTNNALDKLKKMQSPNGGFAWFGGMQIDRYMTQTILAGLGKLKAIGIAETGLNSNTQQIANNAMLYLAEQLNADYKQDLKLKNAPNKIKPSAIIINYLYARSFFDYKVEGENNATAIAFYTNAVAKYWTSYSLYEQAMIAVICNKNNKQNIANDIVKSLKQNAINSNELGMYWPANKTGYYWHEAPIETQCAIIEAFNEVGNNQQSEDEMKLWLLKNKQTNNWRTTKATADACYAFLKNNTDLLANAGHVVLEIDSKKIDTKNYAADEAIGYNKIHYANENITPAMGNIKATNTGKSVSWGAVYYQYTEQLDKINEANTNLKIVKTLYKMTHTNEGKVLVKIDAKTPLKVGDKLVAKLELRVDRAMEYVHLKDIRGACCEPLNVLSGYKYQNGLGYYEATKDAATNFYFDQLPKGYFTFEYEMFVTIAGTYSNGIAQVQCMYAPEFSAHSAGEKIMVK
jgi:Bacterial Alpha-2-macroglobulin MG10 domain/Alpha-2-macroglobulin family/MG2 domain